GRLARHVRCGQGCPRSWHRRFPARLVCSPRQVRPGTRPPAGGLRGPNEGDGQLSRLRAKETNREVCRPRKGLKSDENRPFSAHLPRNAHLIATKTSPPNVTCDLASV